MRKPDLVKHLQVKHFKELAQEASNIAERYREDFPLSTQFYLGQASAFTAAALWLQEGEAWMTVRSAHVY